jgi:hypothetical protein
MPLDPTTLNALIRKLHNHGVYCKKTQPNYFHEPSSLAAAMAVLECFHATTEAPALWVFGSLSGRSAFETELRGEPQTDAGESSAE